MENHSLIRLFRVQLTLIRVNFERSKTIWSGVTFERTIVWSEAILCAQLSGQCMISVWSEVISVWQVLIRDNLQRTLSAHGVSSALQSDQWTFWSPMVWPEVNFVWHSLIRGHFQMPPQPITYENFICQITKYLLRKFHLTTALNVPVLNCYISNRRHMKCSRVLRDTKFITFKILGLANYRAQIKT